MVVTQEFIVIPTEGGVRVHGVPDFPPGTTVGPHAQLLHVEGPIWVRQPRTELSHGQWERWLVLLKEAGWAVTVEPFWTGEPSGHTVALEDVRDELLRSAR